MPETPRIRVVIADDHPLMRLGLRTKLAAESDIEVVAEAEDGPAAVAAYAQHRPDVMLLDLRMPGLDGTEVITTVRRTAPDAKIVILTTYDADEDVYRAVQAGARGYVLKGTFAEGILEAIRTVHAGRRLIAPEIAERLAARVSSPALSAREISVLELVAKGMSNKEIAAALFVSEATVKFHLKNVYLKLGVEGRTEAALLAAQRGIIAIR
jgi:two-component system NarL family response regulator